MQDAADVTTIDSPASPRPTATRRSGAVRGVVRSALACTALVLIPATPLLAQQHVADTLSFLVVNRAVDTGSAQRDEAAALATSRTITTAVLANLATLPVSSTSASFSYRLNPALGTVERATSTFGPLFVDRATMAGAGTAGVGFTYQRLHFTALDGHNLRDGLLVTTANRFADEPTPFDIDQLTLALDADVLTAYASAGLGDRIEVGAAAPLVWLRLDGTRVNTYRGRPFTQASATADALGLADVLLRAKGSLYQDGMQALAAGVDVRLPTGRREDLLGSGRTSVRMSLIGSVDGASASAHAVAGITLGGLATAVDYGVAATAAVTPRVTFSAEATGRWLDTPGTIRSVVEPHPTLAGVETTRLLPGPSRLQTVTLTPGVKWNIAETWVLVAHVGVPLLRGGLRAPLLPFAGIEYSLGR